MSGRRDNRLAAGPEVLAYIYNPANLPPLSPQFVYLKQDLFIRAFEY